jgi:hypothetical protein
MTGLSGSPLTLNAECTNFGSSPTRIECCVAREFWRFLAPESVRLGGGCCACHSVPVGENEIAAPMRDRLADPTNEPIWTIATTAHELACQAAVLLDWLDPQRTDFPGLLSASLCRDILLLFPTEA